MALNKYWRVLDEDEYLHKMDVTRVRDIVTVSAMPESVVNWIWEEEKPDGLVWLT